MKLWSRLRAFVLHFVTTLHEVAMRATLSVQNARLPSREEGQTVAEYALVLLVAAAIAAAFLIWARQTGKLDAFFDLIFDKLVNSVDPSPTPAP